MQIIFIWKESLVMSVSNNRRTGMHTLYFAKNKHVSTEAKFIFKNLNIQNLDHSD